MNYKIPITKLQYENLSADNLKQEDNGKKKKEKVDALVEQLKNLQNVALDEYVNDIYKLEYLKGDDTTDEQLKKQATDFVSNENLATAERLKAQNVNEKVQFNEEKQKQNENHAIETANISKSYDNAKQSASDQALKRGIGRSSIIMNMLKDYDLSKINALEKSDEKHKTALNEIDQKISELDNSLSNALKKLDMQTAFEINEKLNSLKKERDERNEKAIKYNNQINETLGEYKKKLLESDEGKAIKQKVESIANDYKKQIVLNLMDYYDALPLSEALNDFSKSEYAGLLDENHFKLIKNYFARRKS